MKPLLDASNRPLYTVRRISDGFITAGRAISNTIPPALPNGGTDYEFLPILIEDAPSFDPTFAVRTQTEAINEATKTVEIKFTVADRPKEERLAAVQNAERFEVTKHVSTGDFMGNTIIALAAVLRSSKGLSLTPDEKAAVDDLVATAEKLQRNAENAAALKAAVDAGEKPDLSAGWVAAEAATP